MSFLRPEVLCRSGMLLMHPGEEDWLKDKSKLGLFTFPLTPLLQLCFLYPARCVFLEFKGGCKESVLLSMLWLSSMVQGRRTSLALALSEPWLGAQVHGKYFVILAGS